MWARRRGGGGCVQSGGRRWSRPLPRPAAGGAGRPKSPPGPRSGAGAPAAQALCCPQGGPVRLPPGAGPPARASRCPAPAAAAGFRPGRPHDAPQRRLQGRRGRKVTTQPPPGTHSGPHVRRLPDHCCQHGGRPGRDGPHGKGAHSGRPAPPQTRPRRLPRGAAHGSHGLHVTPGPRPRPAARAHAASRRCRRRR